LTDQARAQRSADAAPSGVGGERAVVADTARTQCRSAAPDILATSLMHPALDGAIAAVIPSLDEIRVPMKKLLWPLVLFGAPFGALAQAGGDEDGGPGAQGGPPRWGIGLGAIVNDSPYAGEGSRVMPIPLLNYNGERFHIGIDGASWKLMQRDAFELAAIGKLRFDGFDVKDLGRDELARNGIDASLLEDRDLGFDIGLGMKWTSRAGEIELELLADATDTSGGQEASIQYGYPIELGRGVLTPSVGLAWQSEDLADYYYGTLDAEVARGVVDYKPGAITLPSIGLSYFRPIGEKWSLIAFANYASLPDEIQDSPLIEPDTDGKASLFLGFSRGF